MVGLPDAANGRGNTIGGNDRRHFEDTTTARNSDDDGWMMPTF